MTDKLNVERLRALDEAATAGPWAYRPDEHDDWGLVKAAPYRPAGFEYDLRFVLAQFRDPNATDPITQHEHRAAKTDPWRGNAELVTYLRNAVPAILAMAEDNARLVAEVERLLDYARSIPPAQAEEQKAWSQAVTAIMARCEALEDEASAMNSDCSKVTSFYSGQKMAAKSLRRELHDLTRALGKDQA